MPVEPAVYAERLQRTGDDLDRLVRRLQTLSTHAWATRREPVVELLHDLVRLAGLAEHRPMPTLPDLGAHALADATSVLAGDVAAALRLRPDEELAVSFTEVVSSALQRTR